MSSAGLFPPSGRSQWTSLEPAPPSTSPFSRSRPHSPMSCWATTCNLTFGGIVVAKKVYYDNSDPGKRFQPGTTAEGEAVDEKFDEIASGLEEAEKDTRRA